MSGGRGAAVSAVVVVLFVYSGALKWIPYLPADPTLLFGAVVAGLAVWRALLLRSLDSRAAAIVVSALLFNLWYLATVVVSPASEFRWVKASSLVLNMIALLGPLLVLRTFRHFVWVERTIVTLAAIATAIVLGFYLSGNMDYLIYQGYDREALKIPDYLVIATLLGVAVVLLLNTPRLVRLALAGVAVAVILLLTARGPLLFLVVVTMLGGLLTWRRLGAEGPRPALVIALVVALGVAMMTWDGAQAMFIRFAKLFDNTRDLEAGLRLGEFGVALQMAREHPWAGVGLGGFGPVGYGVDANVYPHNLLLEALAEAGVVGLVLFVISQVVVVSEAWRASSSPRVAGVLLVIVFLQLNYLKSGGFVGARDLYFFQGVLAAWLAWQSPQVSSPEQVA